jgi:HAD superfamily hydrolase (TIGR01509 family)
VPPAGVTGLALLVDLDGTLADSLGVMRLVYDQFLEGFGVAGSPDEFASLNGPPTAEVVRALQDTHGLPGSHDVLLTAYLDLVDEAYRGVVASPGADALLAAARRSGWRTGVVTSSTSALARSWLRTAGLSDLVDEVVGGEMVTRGKPDPEPYVRALRALSAGAAGSVAVEDSPAGVAAALCAGLRTFVYRPAPGAPPPPEVEGVVQRLDALVGIFGP